MPQNTINKETTSNLHNTGNYIKKNQRPGSGTTADHICSIQAYPALKTGKYPDNIQIKINQSAYKEVVYCFNLPLCEQ